MSSTFTVFKTSDDIIESIQRVIAIPLSQQTFSTLDLLRFCNEEMFISQVPSVLQYHEEYFVYDYCTPLLLNQPRYAIPNRAIGMRLRDVNWSDNSGNLFEMTRINADDKSYFQRSLGANNSIHKFYIEGNDIVLTPTNIGEQNGDLHMYMFIRPNQLVPNNRAATITNFLNIITVANVAVGDTITIGTTNRPNPPSGGYYPYEYQANNQNQFNPYPNGDNQPCGNQVVFTGVASGATGTQFNIGSTNTITAANLAQVINSVFPGIATISAPSNTIQITANSVGASQNISASSTPLVISSISVANPSVITTTTNHGLTTGDNIFISMANATPNINGPQMVTVISPTTFSIPVNVTAAGTMGNIMGMSWNTNIQLVQFSSVPTTWLNPETNQTETLFTNGSIVDMLQTQPGHKIYDFDIPIITGVGNSNNILTFNVNDLAQTIIIGDYMCLANECIIPYLPPDLHNVLVEKTASRILAAQGDMQGLQMSQSKIADMEKSTGVLLNNRTEGAPEKVLARHSLLRYGKNSIRRRY